MNDLKFAFRQLLKNPGFTAVVVLTLALGIGANTAIFSVINAAFIKPLPYPKPGQLVQVRKEALSQGGPVIGGGNYVGGHEFVAWRDQSQTVSQIAGYGGNDVNLSGNGQAERVLGGSMTADFFPMLGVRPQLGRLFLKEEELPNSPRVVVLSHGLWQRRYGGDPAVLGKTILLDNESHEIIGVLPASFQFPEPYGICTPMRLNPVVEEGIVAINLFRALARIKPGVTLPQAEAEFNLIARRVDPFRQMPAPARPLDGPAPSPVFKPAPGEAPNEPTDILTSPTPDNGPASLVERNVTPAPGLPADAVMISGPPDDAPSPFRGGGSVKLVPLHEHLVANVRPALLVLLGAVALVLLIACANVANLLLVRTTARRKEIAVRAALGAARFRVVRQFLTEAVLLSLAGGILGLLLAHWSLGVLATFQPLRAPHVQSIGIDARVFTYALVASVLTGFLFGAAPAFQAARINLNDALKTTGRGADDAPGRRPLRGLLVITETALALVLLAGAGLLLKSFVRLRQIEPGFRAERLLTFQFSLDERRFPQPEHRAGFVDRAMSELAALPGVEGVAMTDHLPLTHYTLMTSVSVEGQPPGAPGKDPPISVASVTPGYFQVLGMKFVQGRSFTEQERNAPLLVVNQSFARHYFPGESAVGKRVRNFEQHSGEADWLSIVGVVADARQDGPESNATPEIYRLENRRGAGLLSVALRTAGDPMTLAGAVRTRMQAVDTDVPIYGLMSMEQRLAATTAPRRVYLLLLGSFATLAVLLAAVGIYGVMSFTVAQRAQEIGVRMALGAQRQDVLVWVIRQGMKLAVVGAALGVLGALGLTRWLTALLFEVKPTDPLTFAVVSLALIVVALLACWLPARRAAKVDPMQALRYE